MDQVLTQIQNAGRIAVLHREEEVASHAVDSDVDLCVTVEPLSIISAVAPRLRSEGILPILIFHYDRGSYSFFFSNAEGTGGAQVDLLHDPRGLARYGVRTDVLLAKSCAGARWPRVDRLDEALYVLRKRQVKGDLPSVALARDEVMAFGFANAIRRIPQVFGGRAASGVTAALTRTDVRERRTTGLWRSRFMRPSRVLRRCGFWVHVTGDSAQTEARQLSRRMNRLISASTVTDPSLGFLMNNLWRPRLVVSAGGSRVWPRPDVLLGPDDSMPEPGGVTALLVASMHERVLSTFRLESRDTGS